MKCPMNEMPSEWNVKCMKCPMNEMPNEWNAEWINDETKRKWLAIWNADWKNE